MKVTINEITPEKIEAYNLGYEQGLREGLNAGYYAKKQEIKELIEKHHIKHK